LAKEGFCVEAIIDEGAVFFSKRCACGGEKDAGI
jgi:hypothetical protein